MAGVKILCVAAALATGLPLAAVAQTETGFAGMGTADPAPKAAGDSAPQHLTGEAPHPGDAAGRPPGGEPAATETVRTEAAAPATVTIALPETPATPTGLDAPAAAQAQPPAPPHAASVELPVPHASIETPASTPVPVVVELPPAPAAPTGLDAPVVATPAPAPNVSAPAAPVQAAQPVDPLAPVTAAIAQLLAGPATGKDQEAISAFYAARAHAPLFVDAKGYGAKGKAAIARFAAAGDDGLEPTDYKIVKLEPGADAQALAAAELRLAASAILYARHAQAGRFDPARISPGLTPTRTLPDPLGVLDTLAQASDSGGALAAYNPPHRGYAALKAKLAEASKTSPDKLPPRISEGPSIRPGDIDARVPALRVRLGLPAARQITSERIYDPAIVEAVRAFQGTRGLEMDGIVGAGTLAALNDVASPRERTDDIIVNMERWRWLPRDLGSAYVMVNIPEYMVRVFDNGRVIHETRVVVGKPETPTPLLTHDMEYVVVNPSWNIPPSIARKEMLPNLQRDPYYLARQGITIERNGRAVDPGSINWANGLGGYSFRQPPGERNALGRIKFMFPNQHSVYLHDTPSRSLFANDRRTYSHGCVRVQDPLSFGEVVFSLGMPNDGWTGEKIGRMFGGQERYINLKRHIPVHLVYFTAFVDPAGRFTTRPDIYGIDAKMAAMLNLSGSQQIASGKARTATR